MKGQVIGQGGIKITGGVKLNKNVVTNRSVTKGDPLFYGAVSTAERTGPHTITNTKSFAGTFTSVVADGVHPDIKVIKVDDNRTLHSVADATYARVQVQKFANGATTVGNVLSLSANGQSISVTPWYDNLFVAVVACGSAASSIDIHVISLTDTTLAIVQSTTLSVTHFNGPGIYSTAIAYVSNNKFFVVHRTTSQYGLFRTINIDPTTKVATLIGTTYNNNVASMDMVVRKVKGDRVLTLMKEGTAHVLRLFSVNTTTGDLTFHANATMYANNSNSTCMINLTDTRLIAAVAYSGSAIYRLIVVTDDNSFTQGTQQNYTGNSPAYVDLWRIADDMFVLMGTTSGAYGFIRFMKIGTNDSFTLFGTEANGVASYAPYASFYGIPKVYMYGPNILGLTYKPNSGTNMACEGRPITVPMHAIALQSGTSGQTISVLELLPYYS